MIPRRLPEKFLQPLKPDWLSPSETDQCPSPWGSPSEVGHGVPRCLCPAAPPVLTDEDETSCLEELLVAPGGMLPFQYVADTVVLAQPERGIHAESRQQPKHLLPHRQLLLLGDGRRVDHVDRSIGDHGGVHLSIHHLEETRMGWQKGRRGENHPGESLPSWDLPPYRDHGHSPASAEQDGNIPLVQPKLQDACCHQNSWTPKLMPLIWHLWPAATKGGPGSALHRAPGLGSPTGPGSPDAPRVSGLAAARRMWASNNPGAQG